MIFQYDGTPNTPEVNVWLPISGGKGVSFDVCLGKTDRERISLWQPGGSVPAKSRENALRTAKNFVRRS